jgi:hypothetical protein
VRHLPLITASAFIAAMLVWLIFFAPCDVFYWNLSRSVPMRCHGELGR